jgi:hypothetical protein
MLYDFKSGYLYVDWIFFPALIDSHLNPTSLPVFLFLHQFTFLNFDFLKQSSNHVVSILLNIFALLCGHRGMACTFVVHEW